MIVEAEPVRTAPGAHMEIRLINLPVDALWTCHWSHSQFPMNLPLVQSFTVTQIKGQSTIIRIYVLSAVVWGDNFNFLFFFQLTIKFRMINIFSWKDQDKFTMLIFYNAWQKYTEKCKMYLICLPQVTVGNSTQKKKVKFT